LDPPGWFRRGPDPRAVASEKRQKNLAKLIKNSTQRRPPPHALRRDLAEAWAKAGTYSETQRRDNNRAGARCAGRFTPDNIVLYGLNSF
jgi:histidinol-phosphate/aromatic aminotransferase/cobyric acid decarboxylase-like protein